VLVVREVEVCFKELQQFEVVEDVLDTAPLQLLVAITAKRSYDNALADEFQINSQVFEDDTVKLQRLPVKSGGERGIDDAGWRG